MARNVEVLRNYFLGKDPQLKETLSDNSLRLIGIEGKHFVLRTELIQRIKELKDYVDEQDQGLQDAIDTLADTLENEIDRLENKYNITEDTRLYELDNGVYRVITPEIRLYFKQNGSMINDDDLILIKEAKSFFIFSTVPSTDHPAMTYGIADASDGWRKDIRFEEIEQTTNKKDTITESSTDYPSGLAVFNALSNYYTKGQVDALISFIPEFDIEVVETLPTQDISTTTIYLVPSQDPQTANSYDEFIYVDNNWEQIGSTAIDLSDYYTKTEVDGMIPTQTSQLTNNGDGVTNPFVNKYAKTNVTNGGIYLEVGDQAFLVSNGQKLQNRLLDDRDIASMEETTNKVTVISSSSTNTQYPSARAVYNSLPTDFTGTDGTTAGTSGLVPAPAATDNDKFLSADGTWQEAGGGTIANYVPSYMGLKSSNNITITTTGSWTKYRLILPEVARSYGNKFTVDTTNGAVVVGAGVTRVKATLTASWQNSNTADTSFGVYFYDHLTDTWSTLQPCFAENQTAWCTGATSLIIDVTEGDKIGVSFNTWVNGTVTISAQNVGLLVEEFTGVSKEITGTEITYGTTDLTPGVSPLAEGEFYFQYE